MPSRPPSLHSDPGLRPVLVAKHNDYCKTPDSVGCASYRYADCETPDSYALRASRTSAHEMGSNAWHA